MCLRVCVFVCVCMFLSVYLILCCIVIVGVVAVAVAVVLLLLLLLLMFSFFLSNIMNFKIELKRTIPDITHIAGTECSTTIAAITVPRGHAPLPQPWPPPRRLRQLDMRECEPGNLKCFSPRQVD